MTRSRPLVALVLLACLAGCAAHRGAASGPATRQYTFAWPFVPEGALAPRGGTTKGPAVTLDPAPGEAWRALHAPGLTDFERDRRAILAMAGEFRTSFDFLEIAGFRAGFAPDRPYQSWATERVFVLEDRGRFVSLQHLLVMQFVGDDGRVEGPFVTKHWRQDWRYEDPELLVYRGRNTWSTERLSARDVRGTWSQAVFQVDDSPRYESYGRWEHFGNLSTWRSATTWRPLPRREFSVRNDYQVLIGTNRHTITPTGWIQEEENLKVALDDAGKPVAGEPVLAREIGLNRYERLADLDVSAGDRYRARTEPFWGAVRSAWADLVRERHCFTLRAAPDQGKLFVPLFEYAERLADGAPWDPVAGRAFARDTVRGYLAAGARGGEAAGY
jgi:uncharacterized protein DUF6607